MTFRTKVGYFNKLPTTLIMTTRLFFKFYRFNGLPQSQLMLSEDGAQFGGHSNQEALPSKFRIVFGIQL